ncbi:XPA protein C-terminus-domain-containing protein [Clohesyomyces aquaticus]|uniref:DNA repair protein RAD14 n=1 Tax=Clohesyomyces aquaticus TaxID=1231657 RepID=A0A1Y1ZIR8_9PLEO|nr:XPA protein C-terminus-domain-containing protein [Clohesyomyces aquaticus]
MADRPSTPPRATRSSGKLPANPLTPEQVRRMEGARLKAKALAQSHPTKMTAPSLPQPISTSAGTKRPYSSLNSSTVPSTSRDAAAAGSPAERSIHGMTQPPTNDLIQPAKNFGRSEYIDYDFSKMTDTKGGFLSTIDDPHNKAMWSGRGKEEEKPADMTLAEWERERIRRKLRENRTGIFEPGISILNSHDHREAEEDAAIAAAEGDEGADGASAETLVFKGKYNDGLRDIPGKCRECSSLEIDYKWQDIFHIGICALCREKYPDKYSLLTKTEAREDYLLTDPELKDEDLLPHLERPNPHKQSFHNMQLFLRLQVEAYAFSEKKWGGPERLDEEWQKRQKIAKERKEKKFKSKLDDLKKRTRVEAYKRARLGGDAGANFGDKVKGWGDRHVHEWGRSVLDPSTGMMRKRCEECGMEVEELEF